MRLTAIGLITAALSLAALSCFTSAPILADYKTCMPHCMTEHEFDHCHAMCADKFQQTDGTPTTCMLSGQEQGDLVVKFIKDAYEKDGDKEGTYVHAKQGVDHNQGLWEVYFYPTDHECSGIVRLNGDCKVVWHEQFHCKYTG